MKFMSESPLDKRILINWFTIANFPNMYFINYKMQLVYQNQRNKH